MRYNLQNTAGQYFCSTRDSLAYEWVSADALAARGYDGLLVYTEKRHAEQDILQARSPKTVKVGNRAMVRPDFPDMTGAVPVAESQEYLAYAEANHTKIG